ncbi:uncharacterized protein F4817DRAFT_311506 [Daldinia loculata]|uniref:uncharacterized protein n=1 Tax=Daldinia loculata TaxID=103429 RepID=UPI0020C367CD|nr:uncharacterized protein F4817DRAFT_311506 [Daldinia loculata]KAI1651897.1 hypothetical protein F4817DRAFT_311506 [Daldinia loculata]
MYTTYTSSKSEETPIPVPKRMAYQRSISFNSMRCHDPERTSSETEAPRSLLCAYKPLHTPRNIVHATSSGIHGRTGILSNSDSRCADDSQAWWFFLQLLTISAYGGGHLAKTLAKFADPSVALANCDFVVIPKALLNPGKHFDSRTIFGIKATQATKNPHAILAINHDTKGASVYTWSSELQWIIVVANFAAAKTQGTTVSLALAC